MHIRSAICNILVSIAHNTTLSNATTEAPHPIVTLLFNPFSVPSSNNNNATNGIAALPGPTPSSH